MQSKIQGLGRTTTGIPELDRAIAGGFPEKSAILVNGGPGTGKTILGMTFLWNGLLADENGVYFSFGEAKDETYSNMKQFGMDFERFEAGGKFVFLEMLSVGGESMSDEVAQIGEVITRHKAKRAVIDSFTVIKQAFGSEYEGRQVLQTVIQKLIRALGCTTLIISERAFDNPNGFISEGFVTDGIISLTDGIPRKLEIHKMRGTEIMQREFLFTIKGGLDVTRTDLATPEPKERWEPTILAGDMISTGHEDVDSVLGGGFKRGTYLVIEADTNVTFDEIRLFTHGTISNFLSQGLGVLYLPPGGGRRQRGGRRAPQLPLIG